MQEPTSSINLVFLFINKMASIRRGINFLNEFNSFSLSLCIFTMKKLFGLYQFDCEISYK